MTFYDFTLQTFFAHSSELNSVRSENCDMKSCNCHISI